MQAIRLFLLPVYVLVMNVVNWLKEHDNGDTRSAVTKLACAGDGKSFIYLSLPFAGVYCWANDVYCKEIPTDYNDSFRGMSLNFCTDGGCEVSLFNGNYVYVRKGILSIDTSATKTAHHYPSSRYKGLEIIFTLDGFGPDYTPCPRELLAIGFNPHAFLKELEEKSTHGSFLAIPGELWQRKASRLADHLISQDISIEEIRFYLMELLFLLAKESCQLKPAGIGSVSKGQRKIAAEAERIATQDLSQRITVEELAKQFKISPSSLKKYFSQVYGMSFSTYLHKLRMETAAALASEGTHTIGEIAERTGYQSQSKFGTAFREYFGKTPLEFKRLQTVSSS